MRRILSLLVLCALLGGSLPMPAAHAEATQDSDFTYLLLSDNTFMITDYSGTSTDVMIPSEFDGKPVTAIGSSAFDPFNNPGQPKLTSVTLPPSVTMIASFAFARNELTAIEIPSVTHIGRGAFQYNRLQSIAFGKVTFLDEYAFADNQLESVTIPDSLATIGRYAFQNNRLSSVSLPEGLEIIDSYAFNGNQLKTLQIPKSVTAIYPGAFMNNSLGDVAIPPEVTLGGGESSPVFDSKATLYFPKTSVKVFDHAAKYRIQIIPCNYMITYDGNGSTGGTPPSNTPYVCYNRVFKVPIPDPNQDPSALTKTGYTFKGWNTKPDGSGTNYSDGNYPIIYGIRDVGFTLYANWEANSYQVSFDTRGGTQIPAQSVAYGGQVPKPEEPVRGEYTLVGWYTDPEYTDMWDYDNDKVSEDMTLYAKWKWNGAATIASVAFEKGGDHVTGGDSLTVTGVVRDDAGLPVENAVVNLRSALGKWKLTDNSDVSATTDASGRFALEWMAPLVANPESVTIYASVDGTIGIADSRTFQVVPPDESNAELSDLSLGSIALVPEFSGDTYSYTAADVSNVVTSIDVTATTASRKSTLVINYLFADTSVTGSLPAVSGSPVSVPLHTGMNIIRIDVTAGDGINARTFLIFVRRAAQFSVSYETNGGTAIPAVTANAGAHLDEPTPAPNKDGYRFAGWYKDPGYATQWNFEQNTVTGDMTLYAKWERKQRGINLVASSTAALSGHEILVTGTVYDEGAAPQANISIHLSSNLGKWSQTESDKATVTTDKNGTFHVYWKAPYVFEPTSVELSATLDGSSAEPAKVSIQVSPLPGPNPSSDADLAGLTLSVGDLTPRFQAGITRYTADVGYATSSIAIVPKVSDQAATVTVNGNVVESGHPVQVNLNVGPNPVAIMATAEDGTTKTYHVTITRASAPGNTIPVASIKVTSATSSVYEGGTLQMTVSVSPDNATNKQVSWSIKRGTGKAVIDESGLLKAEHAGLVTVQATAQDGSGSVGSQEITIYERQLGGGDTPTMPSNPTTPSHPTVPLDPKAPSDPKAPTVPTTQPSEKPPILNSVPGRPPINVNDAGAIHTILDALTVKLGDPRSVNVPVFADVEDHWAAHSIRLFARLGIVQGYGDGTFKPDASITRGEFASMLAKLFPLAKGTAVTPSFTDLEDSWARDAVLTLASNGIIRGYEDGTFRADQNITRAEMIAILARIVNLTAVKQVRTVNFQDIDRSWAKDQIQQAANAGIISGRSKNIFDPDKSATRAEALTVLLRVISLSSEIEQLLERMN
ncbi:InlB B-repeat-containing protein [Paenibacillus tuaregi]|uniref:InlB B-repeat-containing protein n=1 Tax=Paenibacillus tuaregi TaxID=1816681 RepID=UPI000839764B|nr:InlB B-repeat-containing protein [Paenibacillus tuaregi]